MENKMFFQFIKKSFLFWLSRKIDYPLVAPDCVQINFTFNCNLRCKMCSMHELQAQFKSQNRPYELDAATVKKVIKESAQMRIPSLILIGGEPFLEPRLFEMIDFAYQWGIRGITVVTNGTLMSRDIIDKIFATRLDNLSISLDASSEETFRNIRGENVLKKIIENVNLINEMKETHKRLSPNIVCICTIMDENLEELTDVVNLARKLKMSRIMFQPVVGDNTDQRKKDRSPVFVPEDRFTILDSAIDALIKYKVSSEDNFNFIANNLRHLRLIKRYYRGKLKPQEIPCYAGFNRLQVVQEGKIYFCVSQDKHEATFGDVSSDSLRKLWYSRKARFFRKLIRKCDYPCLQWCSYRDEFIELSGIWEKRKIFKSHRLP